MGRPKKRQRKKNLKRAQQRQAKMEAGWKRLGSIFAISIQERINTPGWCDRLCATPEQLLEWDNLRHPHWVRTNW